MMGWRGFLFGALFALLLFGSIAAYDYRMLTMQEALNKMVMSGEDSTLYICPFYHTAAGSTVARFPEPVAKYGWFFSGGSTAPDYADITFYYTAGGSTLVEGMLVPNQYDGWSWSVENGPYLDSLEVKRNDGTLIGNVWGQY